MMPSVNGTSAGESVRDGMVFVPNRDMINAVARQAAKTVSMSHTTVISQRCSPPLAYARLMELAILPSATLRTPLPRFIQIWRAPNKNRTAPYPDIMRFTFNYKHFTLGMPVGGWPTTDPVVHGGRGSHCRWPGWIAPCEESGLVRSMSAKWRSLDDPACEGSFDRLRNKPLFHCDDWGKVSIE